MVSKPNSLCPATSRHMACKQLPGYAIRRIGHRAGLTLTELLVVIAILVVVTAVLAPLLGPSLDGREVREGARQVNAFFQQAQMKAKQLGRPVGVVIQRAPNYQNTVPFNPNVEQDFAYQLSLAESPPPFRGFSSADRVQVTIAPNGEIAVPSISATDPRPAGVAIVSLQGVSPMGGADLGFQKSVQPNDQIRFNFRGPKYRIYSVNPVPGTSNFLIRFLVEDKPLSKFAVGNSLQFEVFRRPRMSASTPLELPAGSAIVMDLSGVGMHSIQADGDIIGLDDMSENGVERQVATGVPTPRQKYIGLVEFQRLKDGELGPLAPEVLAEMQKLPLTIMFSPDGTIDNVYRVLPPFGLIPTASLALIPPKRPQDKIYLFLGKDGKSTAENFADKTNIWIAIDPESGLVNTAPHIPNSNVDPTTNPLIAIAEARQTAATGQSMGGQ